MAIDPQTTRVDYIKETSLQARHIRLGLLRLDLVHPVISGNKWFKLQENIRFAIDHQYTSVLTFGGAWSNHLVATAAACAQAGLAVTGVVRGFHGEVRSSDTLEQCAALGMHLHFVSREDYNRKEDPAYLATLRTQFNDSFIIPEGGNNELGILGARAIAAYIPEETTLVATAIGTGTTFCGIRQALTQHINMLGLPVMKGGDYLRTELAAHIPEHNNWQLNSNYHWGGFARHKPELLSFMNDFYDRHHIPLDFVYTAKMMQGVLDMIEKKELPEDSHIICIHTGGLQGNSSIKNKLHF